MVTKLKKVAFPSLVLFFFRFSWGSGGAELTRVRRPPPHSPDPSSPFSGGHGFVSVLQHSLVSSSPRTNDSSTSIPPRKSGAALVIESPLMTDGHVACGPLNARPETHLHWLWLSLVSNPHQRRCWRCQRRWDRPAWPLIHGAILSRLRGETKMFRSSLCF